MEFIEETYERILRKIRCQRFGRAMYSRYVLPMEHRRVRTPIGAQECCLARRPASSTKTSNNQHTVPETQRLTSG